MYPVRPDCFLYFNLTYRKEQAWRRGEHQEVMRLTKEAQAHKDKCPVCQGLTVEIEPPLEDQLFQRRVFVGKDVI